MGQREGTVGLGFESADSAADVERGDGKGGRINPRVHQFIKLAIWQGSAAMVTCPAAMTDGAAVLLGRHLSSSSSSSSSSSNLDINTDMSMTQKRTSVFREVCRRLISRDPSEAWTAGQWMTERMGGSDVRGTETVATLLPPEATVGKEEEEVETDSIGLPLGPYSISGFKWFSSATDCDCAVLLAQTRPPGSTGGGLSVFLAPMRLADGRLNGVRIQRLKEKMGTKPVPTAEVEIRGMWGWWVGKEGEGIREISSILNVTRLHTGVANVGYWGRGLSVARGYAKVRRIKGGAGLEGNAQHVSWMAGEEVKYRASLGLVMFGAGLLGVQEQGGGVVEGTVAGDLGLIPRDREDVELLLRIMTPLLKGQTTLAGTAGLRACMESLGGIGYLENNETPELNLARLFRDSVVSSIWEGTTSVMAEDVMRVLKGKTRKEAMRVLSSWVYTVWTACSKVFAEQEHAFKAAWVAFRKMIEEKETDELLFMGREVLERVEGGGEVGRRWC
jgi:alkylation response protein AidB-like acyl-CoA dehydrogenase